MKTLLTAEAISQGGRFGTLQSPVGLPKVTLGNPLKPGREQRGQDGVFTPLVNLDNQFSLKFNNP